ncbi:MAG: hypothetical protein ACM3MK_08635 [Chitinophagales bacterium]
MNDIEIEIIKTFFHKSIQDRAIFELNSSKKRKPFIGRLSHNFQEIFNQKYLIKIQLPNSNYVDILRSLKQYGANDKCYSISSNGEIDGKELSLTEALEKAVGFGMPSIIYCGSGLAYFEAEQESGAPPRFILKK